jgi:hypothetical protein
MPEAKIIKPEAGAPPVMVAPCKGMNCGATDGVSHSIECEAEHSAAIAGGFFVKQKPAVAMPDDVWLIAYGSDGKGSRLVVGWEALKRAWLEAHYCPINHDALDAQQLETLSFLEDEDGWQHLDDNRRFILQMDYEGDWVTVTRVTDASAITALATQQAQTNRGAQT